MKSEPIKQDIQVRFTMTDAEGTATVRAVAGHAQRVGDAWADLSLELFALAESLDQLVAGSATDGEAEA